MAASSAGPVRIAMWSGPRNISTALMRSWEAREDTHVWDEPLYAHYLKVTQADHPGREQIVETYETNWRSVVEQLTETVPDGKRVFYQKHMAHHLLPGMMGPWLHRLSNGFLIRDPGEMLISLAKVMADPTLADTGLPQQTMLFTFLRDESSQAPPVVDARDVLENPESLLRQLCDVFGVAFSTKMLSWKPGPRPTDGVWGRYWYDGVRASTGFNRYEPRTEPVPDRLRPVYEECLPFYETLYRDRLTP